MLKKIIIASIAILTIAVTGIALAQDTSETSPTSSEETITAQDLDVSEPTLLPDSKFYFLKNWGNALKMAFTFGQEKKAELNLKIASERLLEAQKLAEKTDNSQILEKATELYSQAMEKIQNNIAKFKETATSSEAVSKFLDKYTKQQLLHEQILEKLQSQVPTSTMEKIEQARERHMEQFGEVMQKLEDKTQVQNRIENAIEKIKGSDLKEIKNIEILNRLEGIVPEDIKGQIQQVQERILEKAQEKLQLMTPEQQEKVESYLNNVQEKLQGTMPALQNSLNQLKQRIQNKVQSINSSQVVGGDKDEHGCIGSAGYTWCEAKQKCLRTWEESCQAEQEQEQEQNQGTTQNQEQNQNQNQGGQGSQQ